MKILLTIISAGTLLLLSACKTEQDPYKNARVPQKQDNRSSWEKLQDTLGTNRRHEKRPTRGDVYHFHNDELQVYPGRSRRRSESMHESDDSIFKLW